MQKSKRLINKLLSIISDERLRETTVVRDDQSVSIQSESDKGRVINSAPFRRLQQKAQVFPLDNNAAVRTRLTHSLEVAQIGRYLAQTIISKLNLSKSCPDKAEALINFVEASCLLHDIGNPPFGHLGESAIREWFGKENSEFSCFDGNAQGLRLISFLNGKDEFGLNLTATLLLSTIKYPWDFKKNITENKNKSGIFPSNYELYQKACSKLSWQVGTIFPLTYIMDAADDIAYSISDIEDGIEKRIVSKADLETLGVKMGANEHLDDFIYFKTDYIRGAVSCAADSFVNNLEQILNGTTEKVDLIPKETPYGKKMGEIKSFARKFIYTDLDVQKIEIAGRTVISGLLQQFAPLMTMSEENFKAIRNRTAKNMDFEQRLFNFLPDKYVKKYESQCGKSISEATLRRHLVVDFISGMTDDFALSLYRSFSGIDIK